MDTHTPCYLLKHDDRTIFGPVPFSQLEEWAAGAHVSPLDKVSNDQETWIKAPMVPELHMDWLVRLTSEHLYGPTTIGAIQEFLNMGEFGPDTYLINACDGSEVKISAVPTLTVPDEIEIDIHDDLDSPLKTKIRVSLQQKILELESLLTEERRAYDALQERYNRLQSRLQELMSETT